MATTNSTPSCRPASTWSSCPQGTGVHRSAPVGGTGPGLAVIVEAMAIKLDRVDAVGEHGGVLTSAGVRPVRPLTRTRRGAGRQTMEQPRPRRNRSAQRLAVGPTTSPRGAGRIGSGFGAGRSLGVGRRRVRRIRAGRTDRRPTHGVTATVVHPGPDAVVHLPGRRGRASAAPPAARPTGPSSRRRRELARQRAVRPGDRPRRRPAAHRRNAAAARGADPARPMPPPSVDRGVCTGRSWRGPVAARARVRHHSGSRGLPRPRRQRVLTRADGRCYLDVAWDDFDAACEIHGIPHMLVPQWTAICCAPTRSLFAGPRLLVFSSYTIRRQHESDTHQLRRLLERGGWARPIAGETKESTRWSP